MNPIEMLNIDQGLIAWGALMIKCFKQFSVNLRSAGEDVGIQALLHISYGTALF